jgi:hypothetical protein
MASQGSTSETSGVRVRYSRDQKTSNSFDICRITVKKPVHRQFSSTVKANNECRNDIKLSHKAYLLKK